MKLGQRCNSAKLKEHARKLGLSRRKHGHSTRKNGLSPTYNSWRGMVERCNNPRHICSKFYIAKGIKVCERWLKFENFLSDMGERPLGTSLDRIDGNSDYQPSNCRWATPSQQMKNRPASALRGLLSGRRLSVDKSDARRDYYVQQVA